MKLNTVTDEMVDRRIEYADIQTIKVCGKKVTLVALRLSNGHVLVDASNAMDPQVYDEGVGADICLKRLRDRVRDLEDFLRSEKSKEGRTE